MRYHLAVARPGPLCGIGLAALLLCPAGVRAQPPDRSGAVPRFANVFNDHAVLQRDQSVCLWGFAVPGAAVAVTVTESADAAREVDPAAFAAAVAAEQRAGRARRSRNSVPTIRMTYHETRPQPFDAVTRVAKAGPDGRWQVRLDPMPASFQPKFLIVKSGDATQVLHDILVGEVWLCSGQSNMVWGVGSDSEWGLEQLSADYAAVRHCRLQGHGPEPFVDLRRRATWELAVPENDRLRSWSGVAYHFAVRIHRALKVPVGIVNNAVGGSLAETWTSRPSLEKLPAVAGYLADYQRRQRDWPAEQDRRIEDYQRRLKKAKAAGKKKLPRRPRLNAPDTDRNQPAGCYNGLIYPIRRLSLRGVLFLQGENNSIGKWNMYAQSFPQMIRDWRAAFATARLPFGIISLQGFGPYGGELLPEMLNMPPGLFWYAAIRDVHRRTHEELPATGLIATADIGDTANIHPGLKRCVGQRAARWALAQVYGKPILFTGPAYRSMEIQGGKIELAFDMDPNLGKVLRIKPGEVVWWRDYPISRVGKEYRGFFIAGADRRFYKAQVRRAKTPGTLVVWSDRVKLPKAVRYAWSGYPDANAVGHDFLPVFPFRTDDWDLYPDTPYQAADKAEWNQAVRGARQRAERLAMARKLQEARALLADVGRSVSRGRTKAESKQLEVAIEAASRVIRDLEKRVADK